MNKSSYKYANLLFQFKFIFIWVFSVLKCFVAIKNMIWVYYEEIYIYTKFTQHSTRNARDLQRRKLHFTLADLP